MINKYIKNSNSTNYFKNFEDKIINIDWKKINYNRIAFINKAVAKFNDCKYLEIGCQNDLCFNSIITNNKKGVDPNSGGTIKTTSDDFFNNNEDFYDVIFIDGLHEYDQCRKDIINAFKFLNNKGYIFIHDLIPRTWTEANVPRLQDVWCGDVWKVSFELIKTTGIDFNIIIADCGVGVIKKNEDEITYFDDYQNLKNLKFSDFLKRINEINFVNPTDALQLI